MNDLTPSVHTDAQSYDQCEDVKVSWVASGIKGPADEGSQRASDGNLSEIQVMTRV
jgi:hypothetical protein